MKLIVEQAVDVRFLNEEKDGKKDLFIEGIFMQTEVANKNGRIYRKPIMERELNRYISEKVSKGRAMGELGHPEGPGINLDRVSHRITELKLDGTNVLGKALIVNTEFGNTVKGLLEGGCNLGVSSRGLGSLKPVNGIMEVQDDFKICTAADIVADPSAPDAFVNGIMEGIEYFYDEGKLKMAELSHETKKEIDKLSSKELQEAKLRLFENYLNKLLTE